MKKFVYGIVCFVIYLSICTNPISVAFAKDGTWAQVTFKGAYLYRTPEVNQAIKNIICVAENTYYVEILSSYNESLYKVNYNGTSGYIEKDKVKKVNGAPETPYPNNIKLTTYNKNCYLRETPTKENNTISIVPSNYSGLTFIGMTYGEQIGDFDDNIWYYVEYLGTKGYIYNEYISFINTIFPNAEQLSYTSDDYDSIINPLSDGETALTIVILSLPTFVIIFLLYRKPKPKKTIKQSQKYDITEIDERL